jgi:non-ribosomal peptide synthetase component F
MSEEPEGLKGRLTYNIDLFDEPTIERMLGHLRTLLESIVAEPDRRLSELELLTEEERHRLLFEWNDTGAEYLEDRCVHELFEEQAKRTPDAVAVVYEDEQLTYRELNAQANRLAHRLRALGVGPEVPVGICLERGVEIVVALLATLKAGGAYVPLDPNYPPERLAFMLDDSAAAVLITETHLARQLPAFGGELLCLDTEAEAVARHPADNPQSGATPNNLAYVIYTSGSTGVRASVGRGRGVTRIEATLGSRRLASPSTSFQGTYFVPSARVGAWSSVQRIFSPRLRSFLG